MTRLTRTLLPVMAASLIGAAAMPVTLAGAQPMAGPTTQFNPMAARNAVDAIGFGIVKSMENTASQYTASRLNLPQGQGDITMIALITDPGDRGQTAAQDANNSRLSAAVAAAQKTGRAQIIGTGANAQHAGEMDNRVEYGVRVNPDGTAMVIAREYMGDPNNPQTLNANQVRQSNASLQQYGLGPLADNEPGYHTVFAAQIAKDGTYTLLQNSDSVNVAQQFGLTDNRFAPLPRNPVPVQDAAPAVPAPVQRQTAGPRLTT